MLKKERIGERAGPRVGDGVARDQVNQREQRIRGGVKNDAHEQKAPPRYPQREVIEIAKPGPMEAEGEDLVGSARAISRGEGAAAPVGRVLRTGVPADGLLRARPFMCPSLSAAPCYSSAR